MQSSLPIKRTGVSYRQRRLAMSFTYDSLAQITGRLQNVAGQQAYQARFSYDVVGQVTRKVETVAGITHTYDYTYDADGQIATWKAQTDTNTPTVQVVEYDPVDQLLNSTVRSNSVIEV